MRKLFAVFAALLILCACGGGKTAEVTEYDLNGGISSLDPQFAEGSAEQTAIANLFLGLICRSESDNALYPACAESWEVQNNGTRYIFHLCDGLTWSDGTAITSDDFLFAFERMFSPESPSPYAQAYSEIENAAEVLSGEAEMSVLGVSAPDESTLVITLSHADCTFLTLLAQTPAMPCSREFFAGQKGRYGLDADSILTNGAFSLASWTSSALGLVRNGNAPVTAQIENLQLNLNIDRADAEARFSDGVTEACLFDNRSDAAGTYGGWYLVWDRTWSLVLNPAAETLGDSNVRAAVLGAIGNETLEKAVVENSTEPKGLIPDGFTVDKLTYRNVGQAEVPDFPDDPRGTLQSAFERLGVEQYPSLTLLLCEEEPGIGYGGAMQRDWSSTLSLYVNVETLPYDTLVSRVAGGDFDLALVPLWTKSGDKTGGLQTVANLLGEDDYGINATLSEALRQQSAESTVKLLYSAEQTILDEYLALPVCDTQRVFLQKSAQSHIWYSPTDGVTYCFTA